MSYCRFGWDGSDVYVFHHVAGYLYCCGCWLQPVTATGNTDILKGPLLRAVPPFIQTRFTSRAGMIAHLREHQSAGHTVPEYVFRELEREIEDIGDEVT